ncbi:MAG: hypothetical protein IID44_31075 [Planctomycetes bacterium]|nr:hypothetical protein [Planctomycetota bacterium]
MSDVQIQKASDLTVDARAWLQGLFGRDLDDEERVSIRILPAEQDQAKRREAFGRLTKVMDRMAEKAKDIPEEELEALIDEAMDHVRPQPKP